MELKAAEQDCEPSPKRGRGRPRGRYEPWLKLNPPISRATWYRRGKPQAPEKAAFVATSYVGETDPFQRQLDLIRERQRLFAATQGKSE